MSLPLWILTAATNIRRGLAAFISEFLLRNAAAGSNSFRSTRVRALPGGMMADENLVAYCAPMAPQELFAVLTELKPNF
jgi:hypothetical protein